VPPFVPPQLPSPVTDIAVTKVADKTNAVVGQQVTYTITVVNNGPSDAANVVLVDEIPPQETLVSISDTACSGTQVITCNFGTIPAGGSRMFTVTTLAATPGTATNTATVTTTTPETNTGNNRVQVSVPITGPFVPPALPCAVVNLQHETLVAGKTTTLVVTAKRGSAPAAGVRVSVEGPGIDMSKRTDSSGRARFEIAPSGVGVVHVQLAQRAGCASGSADVPVAGEFRPPRLTG